MAWPIRWRVPPAADVAAVRRPKAVASDVVVVGVGVGVGVVGFDGCVFGV